MKKILTIIIAILFLTLCLNNVSSKKIEINKSKVTLENSKTINSKNFNSNYALVIYGYNGDGIILEHHKDAAQTAYDFFKNKNDFYLPSSNLNPNSPPGRIFPQKLNDLIVNDIPEKLGDNKQIFIFITCHGGSGGLLYLQRFLGISTLNLKDWIEDMEENLKNRDKKYSCLTVLINSCYAGNHIYSLNDPSKKRIVITSTDSNSYCYYNSDTGEEYFTEEFFESLSRGKTYGEAWEDADSLIDNGELPSDQNPKIADNFGITGTDNQDTLFPSNRLALRASPSGVKESRVKDKMQIISIKTILQKFLDHYNNFGLMKNL